MCYCVPLPVPKRFLFAVFCVIIGLDHSRQSSGQSQSELWDGVPSARDPSHGTKGTVLGLWDRGNFTFNGPLIFNGLKVGNRIKACCHDIIKTQICSSNIKNDAQEILAPFITNVYIYR